MATDIPLARKRLYYLLTLLSNHPGFIEEKRCIHEALSVMTRVVTKRGEHKNTCDAGMVARIHQELAIDDTRHDTEIALACGFPTAAAAARVSEVRNGLR